MIVTPAKAGVQHLPGQSMDIHPIRTKADYTRALREVSVYFDNEPQLGSDDGDRFEALTTLVEAYEAKHFPLEAAEPNASDGSITSSSEV